MLPPLWGDDSGGCHLPLPLRCVEGDEGGGAALNCIGGSGIHAYHIYIIPECTVFCTYIYYSYVSPVCYAFVILELRKDSCEACSSAGTEYGHCAALRS